LLEAREDIARAIGFKLLLLCRCEC
jgi:hypothetical protein